MYNSNDFYERWTGSNLKAFLTGRVQQVTIKGATPESIQVLSALPQGTVLMGERELVVLLSLSFWCLVIVVWLFLAMQWVCRLHQRRFRRIYLSTNPSPHDPQNLLLAQTNRPMKTPGRTFSIIPSCQSD